MFKAFLWFTGGLLLLVLLIVMLLALPPTRKAIAARASAFLSSKLQTEARVGDVLLGIPHTIQLHDVFVRDRQNDTLLYARHLAADLNLGALFRSRISLDRLELHDAVANIRRISPDTLFNYNFITEAFSNDTGSTQAEDTSSGGWTFRLHAVALQKVRLAYIDGTGGIRVHADLGSMDCSFRTFDLDNSTIIAEELELNKTAVTVRQSASALPEDTAATDIAPWTFGANDLALRNVNVLYADDTDSSRYMADLPGLVLENGQIHLGASSITAGRIRLSGISAKILLGNADSSAQEMTAPVDTIAMPWKIALASLEMYDSELELMQPGAGSSKGFDPSHMQFSEILLKAENLKMNGEDLTGRILDFRFYESRGFDLRHFSGNLHYHPGGASAGNFSLATSHSRLSSDLSVAYSSLEALQRAPREATVQVSLEDCVIGLRDVYYFLPAFSQSLALSGNEKVNLDAAISGSMEEMAMQLSLAWRSSELRLSGRLRDLHLGEKLYVALDTFSLHSGSKDIVAIVPPNTIPKNVTMPDEIGLAGNFHGYLRNFDADLLLSSSLGELSAHVRMDPAKGDTSVAYRGHVRTDQLRLGEILQQPDIGPLTFSVAFDGTGFDTSSFNTRLKLHVVSFVYRQYNYEDLTLDGRLVKRSFEGTSVMRDDNIAFDFQGMVNLDKTTPAFSFRLDLKGADFRKLNFTEDDMRASGLLVADLELPAGHNPSGTAALYDLLILRGGLRHRVDSLVFKSLRVDGTDKIVLSSEKLEGEASGHFLLPEIGTSITNYLYGHFDPDPGKADSMTGPQQITLRLNLKDPSFLTTGLVPGLKRLYPMQLDAKFDSEAKQLSAVLFAPGAIYNDILVDSVRVRVDGNAGRIRSGVSIAQLSDTVNYRFENISVVSTARNDSLGFTVGISKDDSAKVLAVRGVLLGGDSALTLRMQPRLVLGGAAWDLDKDNRIVFGPRPLHISRFSLTNGQQSVMVAHQGGEGSPLHTLFRNFEIASLTSVMQHSVPLISGVMNGSVVIERQNAHIAFRSGLKIDDLKYKAAPIGDLVLSADNFSDPDDYDVELRISGQRNDVVLKGVYRTGRADGSLDMALRVGSLQLAALQPFTGGEVSRMEGWLAGELTVRGEVSNPTISGALYIHEVGFRPRMLDTYLRIPGGELQFRDEKVRLSQLTVVDSLGNRATLNGYVDIARPRDPRFDLRLQTKNFLAMNTDKSDNELYFGKIFLDSDVRVTGTPAKPTINAKATLNKGSNITYIKPEDQILRDESRGIVEFTDSLGEYARIMSRHDSAAVRGIEGLHMDAEINVDRDFELKVIVDPIAGDSLFIRGGGRLHFTMERNGSTALAGKYDITRGGYYLTISDFVKRDFKIGPGSSVTWSGDPLNPYLDINAVYRVKASPYDLVQDQLAGMTEMEANKYRNLLRFDVYLRMMGFITTPQISFDIQLAPEDRGAHGGAINTRLAQIKEDENQLNKQVFALLTLRRFVGENPLEGSGGGGLSSAGRSSASKVLTQQLNTLSDRYVNFVDLDLGVNSYEDYSTGAQQGRTQVQVGVSKQLFNDRVTVRVGGNVDVEGPYAAQNDMNDVAGNLGIDYKLTEDGRYRIKAFRENQYENPIEGEITKTGAGFVFSRDFNRFKNLFRKPRWKRDATAKTK